MKGEIKMIRKVTSSAMWGRRILTGCTLFLGVSFAFGAQTAKISRDLDATNSAGPVNVIVQYNQPPTLLQLQNVLNLGGLLKQELGLITARVFSIPASALGQLAADPNVVYISPDRPLGSTSTGNPNAVLDYHKETINLAAAQGAGLTGAGVGVAIIDSGLAVSPEFNNVSNLLFSQNFVGGPSGSANDLYGHGTHVAGLIAANGSQSAGPGYTYHFVGIAPLAHIINLRVLDQNGSGTDSQVINAIQTAISLKNLYNIRVINLSLGRGVYESYRLDPLCQAVEQAWKAGIVVVVAAGNGGRDNDAGTNGYGTITAPGNDPYAITVGAMNTLATPGRSDDVPASYSSKGPTLWDQVAKPDLVAPGNLIISLYTPGLTLDQEYPANKIPRSLYQVNGGSTASISYFILSGTSVAAPMVSGTVALMLQKSPSLTPDQVKARLMLTAFKGLQTASITKDQVTGQPFSMQADLFTVGAGYLDIQAALSSTALPPNAAGNAMSPTVTVDSQGNVVLVPGNSVIWGGSGTWANTAVWGNQVLSGSDTQGHSMVWGVSSISGDSVLTGNNTVNSDSVLWGKSVLWGRDTSTTDAQAGSYADQP
jgi:serine protease AprX